MDYKSEIIKKLPEELKIRIKMNRAYQLNFNKIGQDVTIWESAKIINAEKIDIGDSVIIDDFVLLMGGQKTSLGNFVHIASFNTEPIFILKENNTKISVEYVILTTNDYLKQKKLI
jgi:acetyltransferase-like isoleucine patch superfamily enzyme